MQLTFPILIVLIPSVISLDCYVCNSNENKTCADGNNLDSFIRTCNETVEPNCRRIDQTVNQISSVVRICGSKVGTKACYKSTGVNHVNVCSCNENLCNNAISLNRQQLIITIISSIVVGAITMIGLR